MSNIINVKEERNVLAFDGDVFDIVANSSNFYLKFDLDEEWRSSEFITVIFDFDGLKCHVELDEDYKCQIPQTSSSKILFSLVAEPDENSKLSSTILSLNVKPSSDDTRENDLAYTSSHVNLLGLVKKLQTGEGVSAEHAQNATNAENASYAAVAGASQTQVSLTGDETIAGVKNFQDRIKHNLEIVPNASEVSNWNYVINGNFLVNQRTSQMYIRKSSDIYTVDAWGLFNGSGKFAPVIKTLYGTDETTPVVLCQWIEDSGSQLYGKTVTASAYIDGVLRYKTFDIENRPSSDKIETIYETDDYAFRVYIKSATRILGVQFLVNNEKSIKIENVKVERSSFVTKYEERSIAIEYMMCQRYYQRVRVFAIGFATAEDKICFSVPFTTSNRNPQNYTVYASPSILINGEKVIPDNIIFHIADAYGAMFFATGSGFTVNQPYAIVDGMIKIEGDYYY